jgi:hypothetical protein
MLLFGATFDFVRRPVEETKMFNSAAQQCLTVDTYLAEQEAGARYL